MNECTTAKEHAPRIRLPRSVRLAAGLLALGGSIALLVPAVASQGVPPGGPAPKGAGGTYAGPGDTVPPGCGGPCPPPITCFGPCEDELIEAECHLPCYTYDNPVHQNWVVDWDDAPACMQGQGARIHEITIGDLLSSCTASQSGLLYYPLTSVCLWNTCPNGVDSVFVYETLPFQHFGSGVPTGDGGSIPVCGLQFKLQAYYGDGYCEPLGMGVQSGTGVLYEPLNCQAGINRFSLQFDCFCLGDILNMYNDFGLYYPGSGLGSFMDWDTVVFVVLIKCCGPSGQGTCS